MAVASSAACHNCVPEMETRTTGFLPTPALFFAQQTLFHRFRESQKNQRNPGDMPRETDGAKHTSAILLQQHGKIALCLRLRHMNMGDISATYHQAV